MRKYIIFLLLFITALSLFGGCSTDVMLHQPVEEIVQIDFLFSPFSQSEIFYTLTTDELSSCIEDILQLKLHKSRSPSDSGGTYIVKITYSNGAVETLGSWSVSYTYGGEIEHDGWHYVSKNDLYELFTQYIDPALIPSI